MDEKEKQRLFYTGDDGKLASGIRAKAAREYAGLTQQQLGDVTGRTLQAISNAENASSFPAREVLMYFFNEHRIEFGYFFIGRYAQLPMDVADGLLSKLMVIDQKRAAKANADQPPLGTEG